MRGGTLTAKHRDDWPTLTAASWGEWTKIVDDIFAPRTAPNGKPEQHHFAFRGQANAQWASLLPSLARGAQRRKLRHMTALRLERRASVEFAAYARLHDELRGGDILDQSSMPVGTTGLYPEATLPKLPTLWAHMQHYGAVTRLLDWSASPYVALYAACREEAFGNDDGDVWWVSENAIADRRPEQHIENSHEFLFDPNGPGAGKLFFLLPPFHSPRSSSQQASFTICEDILADHAEVIGRYMESYRDRKWHGRVIIPAKCKREFLRRLWSMNITGKSLFPDLHGLGQFVADVFFCHPTSPTDEYFMTGR
jgi:hypothetical protein